MLPLYLSQNGQQNSLLNTDFNNFLMSNSNSNTPTFTGQNKNMFCNFKDQEDLIMPSTLSPIINVSNNKVVQSLDNDKNKIFFDPINKNYNDQQQMGNIISSQDFHLKMQGKPTMNFEMNNN